MSNDRLRILSVVGARPNFIKIAPLMAAFRKTPNLDALLVHTGQHYDANMSRVFFDELGIPRPDINLDIRSGTHAEQTAKIMMAFEPIVLEHRPDAVLVVGDVNSTVACGLVAVKLGIPVVHVEAGLRSGDRAMPEEINRILTDAMSDLLFCTEESGVQNLLAEGVSEGKIFLVGNVMIDSLLANREKADETGILDRLSVTAGEFGVLTLHRPSNVNSRETTLEILKAVEEIQRELPVLFPVHPRTRARFQEEPFRRVLSQMENLQMIDPLSYLEFLGTISAARIVLTDSGGIQEETTILGVPCITLRENTERPVTVELGTNRVAGTSALGIVSAYRDAMTAPRLPGRIPPLWDGRAADRIVEVLRRRLGGDALATGSSSRGDGTPP